ncbi:bacillithiol biosynthesis cysteine-adding enzyme BshC [Namhaeicola litoreus]|uniref:Putative cysteine ligase BshC n=1 Tax=Namhaeicola litoreus TaxID=1052145 RepID=A0ABW3Y429_9FLAO
MTFSTLPHHKTGYSTKIIRDYLNQDENIRSFYNRFQTIEDFKGQIEEKLSSYPNQNREVLVKSVKAQYLETPVSELTMHHINLLSEDNTFTVVTGHQLNLFTGPLYFLYKITSTINLCKKLKKEYTDFNFVPVYWMATEDHDFEEINYFRYKNEKIEWKRAAGGPVGRFKNDGLDIVLNEFSELLGKSSHAKKLKGMFKMAYLDHENLAMATRFLANELFGEEGLVIVDGDDKNLKRLFQPYMANELFENICAERVLDTSERLSEQYDTQVNPREINLFYIEDGLRERIVEENGLFKVNETNLVFTKEEIRTELENFPQKFSPNVLVRPLYQEVILPNLCYIGGGGELAYWLQLKDFFESQKVPFPILLLRNSALILNKKQSEKLRKLDISMEELFFPTHKLIQTKIKEESSIEIDFSEQRALLEQMFSTLEELSNKTDRSFSGAVRAQHKKQLNGLANLEKKLLRAEARKHKDLVNRIELIKSELFPKGSLQERITNFSTFYEESGQAFVQLLLETFDPLLQEFYIIELD